MILVFIEHNETGLNKASKIAISAALKAKTAQGFDKAVGLLIGGSGTKAAADEASKYGLDEILYLESDLFKNYLACSFAPVLIEVAKDLGAKTVISLSTTLGKDLMPRVAYTLDAAQASDVLEFLENRNYKRPMFAGNVIADVELTTDVQIVTVRSSVFEPASETSSSSDVKELGVNVPENKLQEFVSFDFVKSERPELTEAEVVISGGRALKSSENFEEFINPLADKLNAAIGASRAAVDSGYAPNDWQVGQTGKVVAPNLYIAAGISGAIQHLAGMKDSKVIVAINKDPEAPIFEVSDYGLVADLFDVLPELTSKL